MRFAGWGTQLFVMLAIAVYGGTRVDKWMKMSFPLFTLLFPFIVLIVMIYQLIKDTSKRKSNGETE
jgi:hypothetical protein